MRDRGVSIETRCFTFFFIAPIILKFPVMARFQNWFRKQSTRGQWAVGCAGIVLVTTACLYSLGLVSYFVRPTLLAAPPAATIVFAIPTVERPTFVVPTVRPTIVLPGSTLEATPTQAPIPTRAPPTETPFFILDPNGTPITITPLPSTTPTFENTQTP